MHDGLRSQWAGSLESIVETATDTIVVAGSDGSILAWNPAAERMFGYSADEVTGRSLTLLVPDRFREAHSAGLARVVATGETRIVGQTVEVFGLHRDGHEFPIELALATWVEEGQRFFSGIIGTSQNGPR